MQQAVLMMVLATMVYTVSLDLRLGDFQYVARHPLAVGVGLVAQFALLPGATLGATLLLDLPPATEAAMMLVAACPGGALSNVVTHLGRGNLALSLSISAVSNVLALLLTSSRVPAFAARIRQPLGRFAAVALALFIVLAVAAQWRLFVVELTRTLPLVIAQNGLGLGLGYGASLLAGLSVPDRRAVVVESGMQNSGLALGIIAAQFGSDLAMVAVAGLWGIWHIVSGGVLALLWRRADRIGMHNAPGKA